MVLAQQLDLCRRIAHEAHHLQTRRDGSPYIIHPQRVAEACGHDHAAACIAWLHDVLEDTPMRVSDLTARGVHSTIITSVARLSKDPYMSYKRYIKGLRHSGTVAKVKVLDIMDNLLDDPTPKQIQKYRQALVLLVT